MSFSLTVTRFGLLSVLIVAAVTHAIAQEKEMPKVEVFGGYSYLRHEGHGLNVHFGRRRE